MVRVLILLIIWLLVPSRVLAVDVPNFPACAAAQGELVANYDSGEHGIVGSYSTYRGSDKVYRLDKYGYTQCYCSTDGNGIQTDWWNASSLTDEQTKVLISQGWQYVASGNIWGLSQDPYLARNSTYSCLSTTPSPSSTPTPSSSNNNGSSSSSSSDNSGEVLGLAATGNSLTVIAVFAASVTLLYFGIKKLLER